MRADPSGISLTEADAAIIKGMLARGDRQHDIAAWFGVNGGKIGEISTGAKFGEVEAQENDLPAQGPYAKGKNIDVAMTELEAVKNELGKLIEHINDQITLLKTP